MMNFSGRARDPIGDAAAAAFSFLKRIPEVS